MFSSHRIGRLLRATMTAVLLLATVSAGGIAHADETGETTPVLGDSITLNAGPGSSLNGADFKVVKLAGFTIQGSAVTVRTEDTVRGDVIASLPKVGDSEYPADAGDANGGTSSGTTRGNGGAADTGSGGEDPIVWLARQGDAKDSPAWRLFADRMADTVSITDAPVMSGTTTPADDGTISSVVFAGLQPGLYLLEDANTALTGTTRSAPILVGTAITAAKPPIGNADGAAEIKNQRVTIGKSIIDGDDATLTDDRNVGDIVDYRIETLIPDTAKYANDAANPYVFRLTDTLSKGQRFNDDLSVTASKDGRSWSPLGNDDYTLRAGESDGGTATAIDLDLSAWVYANGRDGMAGGLLRVDYSAMLTEHATIDGDGNTNTVTLTYSNDPKTNQTGELTPPDTTVYTHGFQFDKIGEDGKTPLAGATFTLYTADTFADDAKYRRADRPDEDVTATSDRNGLVRFDGLAAGTYWVRETGVPDGYRDLDVRFKVTITADPGKTALVVFERVPSLADSLVQIEKNGLLFVRNVTAITNLPLTGSGGIVLFLVIGGLLAAGGAIIAVMTYRKGRLLK